MRAFRRILFAVKNPDARRQPGIEKAIHIAKRLGARLELFHAISTPVFLEITPLTGRSLADIKRESLELRQRRLEKHVAPAVKRGMAVTCTVVWDYPPHEAIVRRATHSGADLIIAECHKGSRLKPWLMHLTDWELLQQSPVPVLLLRNVKPYQRPLVLAAVDPAHAHAKPARLDAELLAQGARLSQELRGRFHVMHANFPAVFGITAGDPSFDTASLAAVYEQQKAKGRKNFEAFAAKTKIPRARRHVVDGDPAYVIPKVARKIGADIVVMGAVSRSGLKRVFIGNTAERVLNELPCDVLVVKPGRFTTRVPDESRGMRVIAPPPLMPPLV